ncbi:MAG: carotenoid biosynthesis protein [Deltaproteobacteria bacterium]
MTPAIAIVQLCSVPIVLVWFWSTRGEGGWGRRAAELAALGVGAFLGEELCLRGYRAYGYAPGWSLFIDRLPLAVALIWPVVVLSGRTVAATLFGRGSRVLPLATGLVVAFDASLVEPIATHLRLWHWNLPGPFAVPLIGPFGWGCYAAAAVFLLDRLPGAWLCALPVGAALLAHALILAGFWGGLRFVSAPVAPWLAVAGGLALCGAATLFALRRRRTARLSLRDALPRALAASLFFGLLGLQPDGHLAVFALGFCPPYLALLPAPNPRSR